VNFAVKFVLVEQYDMVNHQYCDSLLIRGRS